jgi:hypothetical protein
MGFHGLFLKFENDVKRDRQKKTAGGFRRFGSSERLFQIRSDLSSRRWGVR